MFVEILILLNYIDYLSGHSSLVGVQTGKVLEYDVRIKLCSICQYHLGRKETIPIHDCNSNWQGTELGSI